MTSKNKPEIIEENFGDIEERRRKTNEVLDQEIEKWDALAPDYDKHVYSITYFQNKRQRIVNTVQRGETILIAGCGSATFLQEELLSEAKLPAIHIIASDFSPEMLKVSAERFSSPGLTHKLLDTRNLGMVNELDRVIVTNSVVPETRENVVRMYQSIHSALKEGGEFVGYFPSFTMIEQMSTAFPILLDMYGDRIDFKNQRFLDTVGWQCWHTEETLRRELNIAGFNESQLIVESVCSESDEESERLGELYDLDPNLMRSGFSCYFVRVKK